jgi:hypothetical protein
LNPKHVEDLVEVLEAGGKFEEDPEVYHDDGIYWIGDGFHRIDAYEKVGRDKIHAVVREGGRRDAMLHAVGANATHGLPRSQEDKRRAVRLLLEDKEWGKKSDRAIAKKAAVTDKTVAAVKRELGLDGATRVYTDKHGNESVMNVAGIGKRGITGLCATVKAETFHDLPGTTRDAFKRLLREMSLLPKLTHSLAREWLEKAAAMLTPKEHGTMLTKIEAEEESGEPADLPPGDDRDDPKF